MQIIKAKQVLLLSLLLWISSSVNMWAQDKIAYVDTDEVIKSMPDYTTTQKSLETFQKKLLEELDAEKRAIAKFYTQVIEEVKAGLLTAKQQQEAEDKLQKMQTDLQARTNQADQRLAAKEKALTAPLYEKFEAALKAVAQKNKYTYILDKKLMLYSAGGIDATRQMKKQLGI
jgi:outer membrane protein